MGEGYGGLTIFLGCDLGPKLKYWCFVLVGWWLGWLRCDAMEGCDGRN